MNWVLNSRSLATHQTRDDAEVAPFVVAVAVDAVSSPPVRPPCKDRASHSHCDMSILRNLK